MTELVNEFLRAKARAGRSDRYLRQLRVSLKSFAAGRHQRTLSQVNVVDVEKWLFGNDWSAKTIRGYYGDVKGLFAFAVRRGYSRDMLTYRGLTMALIAGIVIGFILGKLI